MSKDCQKGWWKETKLVLSKAKKLKENNAVEKNIAKSMVDSARKVTMT